jgi:2-dehydropantoate 2-reductase
MLAPLRIAIFGMGAITTTIARALLKSKVPFTILCRNEERKSDLLNQPIYFQFASSIPEPLNFADQAKTLDEISGTFDYIWIGAKSKDLALSIDQVKHLLGNNGKVILIQNGFPEEKVNLPAKQIIGGVVGWNTQRLNTGVYFQSNPGSLILGGADGEIPNLYLKTALQDFVPTILTNNLKGYRWHKLGINSVINGLSASCMLALGELMLNSNGRRAAITVLSEVRSVMEKFDVVEGVVPGSLPIRRLGRGKGALPLWLSHLLLIGLGIKYFKIRTSMVQDLDAGRMTEIMDLNGLVVQKCKDVGLTCPANEKIVARVQLIEKEAIQPNIEFLSELQ